MKKCKECGIDVPPTFARALLDNRCPACGKAIMSGSDFTELRQVRNMLADLQLDEKLITTIAAAISSKFDLVPKTTKPEAPAATIPQAEEAPKNEESEYAGMTEEQIVREKAFRAAQKQKEEEEEKKLAEEWGLDKVPDLTKKGRKPPPPQPFIDMFEAENLPSLDDIPPEAFASGGNPAKSADRAARLAKSEAVRNDSSKFKVRRD